ncbi:LAME_0F03114g1_1 [Lachancea meyersii CBS 8951]|uniref:LAME_0F03114g1_1 n=1 Tax=Lachancea meyersii CBS 8951 TaxID=1266667 RepID=A0A1G4JR89_9SACH|nr:LAME_0F03114g1_1 [Lachancea meyersii CBS 8951]
MTRPSIQAPKCSSSPVVKKCHVTRDPRPSLTAHHISLHNTHIVDCLLIVTHTTPDSRLPTTVYLYKTPKTINHFIRKLTHYPHPPTPFPPSNIGTTIKIVTKNPPSKTLHLHHHFSHISSFVPLPPRPPRSFPPLTRSLPALRLVRRIANLCT